MTAVASHDANGSPARVLLFTDTLADVNGVSRFIRNIADEALALGRDLHVVTSTRFDVPIRPNLLNFKPLAARAMPGYPNLELALPPPLRMLRLVRGFKPSVIQILYTRMHGRTRRRARDLRITRLRNDPRSAVLPKDNPQ